MNFWHRRDPRAKVFAALAVSAALTAAPAGRVAPVLAGATVLLVTARAGWKRLWSTAKAVALLWGLSLVANGFLMSGHRAGPEFLGWLRPTGEGLRAGFQQGARLAALTALAAWVVATTRALDLAGSVEWTVRGVPAVRRRAHRALLPLVLSLRLLPMLLGEAQRLLDVDRLREGRRRRWAEVQRGARLAPVWMVTVVERAEALALALTLRGYDPRRERGFVRRYRMGWLDWGLIVLALLGVWQLERG